MYIFFFIGAPWLIISFVIYASNWSMFEFGFAFEFEFEFESKFEFKLKLFILRVVGTLKFPNGPFQGVPNRRTRSLACPFVKFIQAT